MTEPQKRTLMAMYNFRDGDQNARDRAMYRASKGSEPFLALCRMKLADSPGVLTEAGEKLAAEMRAAGVA